MAHGDGYFHSVVTLEEIPVPSSPLTGHRQLLHITSPFYPHGFSLFVCAKPFPLLQL